MRVALPYTATYHCAHDPADPFYRNKQSVEMDPEVALEWSVKVQAQAIRTIATPSKKRRK